MENSEDYKLTIPAKYIKSLLRDEQSLEIDYNDANKITQASPILVGGTQEIDIPDMDLRDVERWLFIHPVVPRGIEIRANKIVGRGYTISGKHEEANKYIEKILHESGGILFLKRYVEDAIAFGNGWADIITNKAKNEVLKCDTLHPIYFGFAKKKVQTDNGEQWIKVIDKKSQKPIGYQQYSTIDNELQPVGNIIPKDRALHLAFDTWGDDPEGVSVIKYLRTTLQNIATIERAAAVSGERTANPRYKFTTNIKSEQVLKKFAQAVDNINERDAIILTEGNDVEVLSPGNSNFAEYHDKFLALISTRLGVPKTILFGDGTNSNKATLKEMTDFMREEYRTDEEFVKRSIQNQLIDVAIKLKYGESFQPENYPQFDLKGHAGDDASVVDRLNEKATVITKLADAATKVASMGNQEAADKLIDYMMNDVLYNSESRIER